MDLCQVAQEERAHEIYKFEIARQKETRTSPFVDPTSGNRQIVTQYATLHRYCTPILRQLLEQDRRLPAFPLARSVPV